MLLSIEMGRCSMINCCLIFEAESPLDLDNGEFTGRYFAPDIIENRKRKIKL